VPNEEVEKKFRLYEALRTNILKDRKEGKEEDNCHLVHYFTQIFKKSFGSWGKL
jgi:hypothetical protein